MNWYKNDSSQICDVVKVRVEKGFDGASTSDKSHEKMCLKKKI